VIAEFGDALVDYLNDGEFREVFTAARSYDPRKKADDLTTLAVTVALKVREDAIGTRAADQKTLRFDIAVRMRVESDSDADHLLNLLEEIADYVDRVRLTDEDGNEAVWQGTEIAAIYSPEHYQEQHIYFGLVTVTYLVLL